MYCFLEIGCCWIDESLFWMCGVLGTIRWFGMMHLLQVNQGENY